MRAGLLLVVAVYVASALFGVAAPLLWGHHGYHGATYLLRAVMTLRFHIVTPSNWAGYEYPPRFTWYFHHPIGYHHLLVPFVALFGPREWLARGFAAAGGLLVLWALYVLVKRHWSREAGLLATAVYVTMPFVAQFAVLLDPMLPTMALTLVALDAFLRYWERPERRTLLVGCAAFVGAGLLMWDGFFEAFFLGVVFMATLATRAGRSARLLVDGRPTRWNAPFAWTLATGVASVLTMAFHFLFTWKVGMMGDFKASYNQRHAAGFDYVYGKEQEWAQLLFGKPLLVAGALWLLLFVGRAAAGRARRRDVAVWIFFVNKTFYIYLFREAAAVHEYRVDWYLVFLTLAVCDLASDLSAFVAFLLARRPRLVAIAPSVGPLVGQMAAATFALWFLAFQVPLGYRKLVQSRETMGTDLPGYNADYARQLFGQVVAAKTGPEDFVFTLTTGFPRRIEFYYYMDRSNLDIFSLSQLPSLRKAHPRSLLICNPASLGGSDREILVELLRKHPGELYDGYLVVDLRSDKPGLRDFTFVAQPTSAAYRYFVSHKFPPMKAVPRTSRDLECLYAETGITPPADLPPPQALGTPTAEQAACRHAFSLLRGDRAGADAVVERLRALLTRADAPLGPSLRVVAVRADASRGKGADLWLRLEHPEHPEGLPPTAGLRLRLVPDPAPQPRPLVSEQRVTRRLSSLPPGSLFFERVPVAAGPGRYHATVELLDYAPARPTAPAPPSPPSGRSPARPPALPRPPLRGALGGLPPPPNVVVAGSADLGRIEIR